MHRNATTRPELRRNYTAVGSLVMYVLLPEQYRDQPGLQYQQDQHQHSDQ